MALLGWRRPGAADGDGDGGGVVERFVVTVPGGLQLITMVAL